MYKSFGIRSFFIVGTCSLLLGSMVFFQNCGNDGGVISEPVISEPLVNGLCGADKDECAAGTWSDFQDDQGFFKWACLGEDGGNDDSPCTKCRKSEWESQAEGVCSTTKNTCNVGYSYNEEENLLGYFWGCATCVENSGTICTKCKVETPDIAVSCKEDEEYGCNGGIAYNKRKKNGLSSWGCIACDGTASSICSKCEFESNNVSCGTTQDACINGTSYNKGETEYNGMLYWGCVACDGTIVDPVCSLCKFGDETKSNVSCGETKDACVNGVAYNEKTENGYHYWMCLACDNTTTATCSLKM